MSESSSDAEHYADRAHKCLRLVPVYKTGAFSCSSPEDDDDDDEDVKRILEERGEPEPKNCEAVGFSSVYRAAVEAADTTRHSTSHSTNRGSSLWRPSVDQDGEYADWDQALDNVVRVYPALGVCSRSVPEVTEACRGAATAVADDTGAGSVERPRRITTARDLRKRLEGALQHGRDTGDFVVAQPHCVADKNLDFGKSRMSQKAVHASRNKVENWMSKYVGTANG